MLSKQGWLLLLYSNSLAATLLKVKYFNSSSVLEVNLSDNSKYTWPSIFVGIDLLKRGCMERIGDGFNTKVWTHPWIKTHEKV